MKKTILLFSLLLASFYGFSQNSLYGVRAGVNFSTLNFDSNIEEGIKGREMVFLLAFLENISCLTLFHLLQKFNFLLKEQNNNLRINYIQLPLYFKYKIADSFAIGFGPQASLKGHSYEDGFQNLGFSALGGLEYMISDEFFIDARYSYGFTNGFEDNPLKLDANNTNIQIGLGVKF